MRLLTRLLVPVLLIAAGVVVWWLDTARRPDASRESADAARHEPDYYFDDFRLRAFEAAGTPTYVLEGARLLRYADDGSAEVEAPRLRYTPAGGNPWHARGERGRLGPDGDRLDIDGDVLLEQRPANAAPTFVETPHLTVFIAAGRAETDQPIEAFGAGWHNRGVGMTALFEAGHLELHDRVRGRYDPALTPGGSPD